MVSDFAVFLTILTMVILDYLIGVPSPKLQVPNEFKVINIIFYDRMLSYFHCLYVLVLHTRSLFTP